MNSVFHLTSQIYLKLRPVTTMLIEIQVLNPAVKILKKCFSREFCRAEVVA